MPATTAHRVCVEKEILLDAYQKAMASYLAALRALRRNVRRLPKEDFDKAFYKMTEVRLQDVAATRFKLQAHIHQHGC